MPEIGTIQVYNEGPKDASIYIVGEAPGADEVAERRPFIGESGRLLRDCLARAGVSDTQVRFLNLCQYRPPNNAFAAVLKTPQLMEGIEEIKHDIIEFKPRVVAALGNWPLVFLTGKHGKKGPGSGIGKWRGSILPTRWDESIKCVGCYHPAFIARQRESYPIFSTDIKRVAHEATFPEFNYPIHEIIKDPRGSDFDSWVDTLCKADWLTCDIESVKKSRRILCHGFSTRPGHSVVFAERPGDFQQHAGIDAIYRSAARKTFHNGYGFDIIMLNINDYLVENYVSDTMAKQFVMWGELPKSLEYLTSVYTRQPYYKTAGRAEIPEDAKSWSEKYDKSALYEYNGTDTSCTAEIDLALDKEIEEGPEEWKRTIQFTMDMVKPAVSISVTGMRRDDIRNETIRRALRTKWAIQQFALDRLTGFKTNVNSTKALPKILYDKDKMALPVRKNRDGGLTTDEDAIVSLIGFVKDKISKLKPGGSANAYWNVRYEVLKAILLIRGLRKCLSSYINVQISDDGRVRGTYKITGAETGRWSCSKFIDGTGMNCQTYPRESVKMKKYEEIPELKNILEYIFEEEVEDTKEEEGEDDAAA